MKRAGKIVASISSGLCFLLSILMIVWGWLTASSIQYLNTHAHEAGQITDEYAHELSHLAESVEHESLFEEMKRHGIIGAITSLITFIACFITLLNRKFLFPAIATGSAVIGAIFCGWLIMSFLLVAVGGIGLIVFSLYLDDKKAEQPT